MLVVVLEELEEVEEASPAAVADAVLLDEVAAGVAAGVVDVGVALI